MKKYGFIFFPIFFFLGNGSIGQAFWNVCRGVEPCISHRDFQARSRQGVQLHWRARGEGFQRKGMWCFCINVVFFVFCWHFSRFCLILKSMMLVLCRKKILVHIWIIWSKLSNYILKFLKINTSNPGHNSSGLWSHWHHSCI